MFGEMEIYHCSYAFDPCFEVWEKNNTLDINIYTNKRGNGDFLHITSLRTIII